MLKKNPKPGGKPWLVQASFGTAQKRKRFGRTFDTKADAQKFEANIAYQYSHGVDLTLANLTLPSSFDSWVTSFKKPTITEVTLEGYHATYAALQRYFPNMKVRDVTSIEMQRFFNAIGKRQSKATSARRYHQLKTYFASLRADGIIDRNPVTNVHRTGLDGKDEEVKFLSSSDFTMLRESLYTTNITISENWMVAALIAIDSGLRIAEIQGLTWDDIDFTEQTINVDKSWDARLKLNKPPKTKTSNRVIRIPDRLVAILQKYQLIQKKWQLKNGINNQSKHLLLSERKHSVVAAPWLNRKLMALETKLNIETPVSFHGLRHSHASYLIYNGVTIGYVSKRLGHASIEITQRVYVHVLPEEIKTEDAQMEALLGS